MYGYNWTDEQKENLTRDDRKFTWSLSIDGSNPEVYSLKFVETACEGNITMGAACSNYVEFTMAYDKTIKLDKAVVKPTLSVYVPKNGSMTRVGSVPLGEFYVTEFSTKDGITSITAYDTMALLNTEYVPSIKFPATTMDVLYDIKKQSNFDIGILPWAPFTYEEDEVITGNLNCTKREMLGYIAGFWGCNACFNRDGELDFRWFNDGQRGGNTNTYRGIKSDDIYLNSYSDNPSVNINAIVSGEGDNEITSGSGRAITFANPFMTQGQADSICYIRLNTYGKGSYFTYRPQEFECRGNPTVELYDEITINSLGNNYVMKQEMTFDGGLRSKIYSYSMTETEEVISDFKSDTVTLERNLSKIESMQKNIIGTTGGYYDLLLDENDANRPYGTAWWSDASKTTGWKFTNGGLGYFSNNILQKIAITNDGSVLADNITANSILTNSFKIGKSDSDYAMSFDGSTGKISFGSAVTMSWADITDAPTIPSKTSDLSNDSGYITDGDIPTKTSDLTNDSGYINSITATTITNNAISTASISANQITTGTLSADRVGAGSFYITGGYINIDTGADDTNTIRLVGSSRYTEMGPGGLYTAFNDGTYRAFIDAQSGFYVGDGSGNSGGLTTEVLSLSGISLYNQNGHFMFSNTVEPEGSFNWDLGSDSYYWNNVYCYSVNQISDKNFKEDITPLADKYVDLFDKLNPVSFKFKGGNRTHTGFIAQDIETAMNEVGLTSSEFAGFYKSADDVCGLRYTEFISLLTAKVQQLEDRIEVLENGQTTND